MRTYFAAQTYLSYLSTRNLRSKSVFPSFYQYCSAMNFPRNWFVSRRLNKLQHHQSKSRPPAMSAALATSDQKMNKKPQNTKLLYMLGLRKMGIAGLGTDLIFYCLCIRQILVTKSLIQALRNSIVMSLWGQTLPSARWVTRKNCNEQLFLQACTGYSWTRKHFFMNDVFIFRKIGLKRYFASVSFKPCGRFIIPCNEQYQKKPGEN